LFWKKPQNNETAIFHDGSQNQRCAFRYKSEDLNRPGFVFLGQQVKLIDISASGASFRNRGFAAGDSGPVELVLNNSVHPMPLTIKIIMIDSKDVCHCCFEKITEEQKEILHHYVLMKQKAAIRERKKRDTSH